METNHTFLTKEPPLDSAVVAGRLRELVAGRQRGRAWIGHSGSLEAIQPIRRDYLRLVICLSGEANLLQIGPDGGRTVHLLPGDVILQPPSGPLWPAFDTIYQTIGVLFPVGYMSLYGTRTQRLGDGRIGVHKHEHLSSNLAAEAALRRALELLAALAHEPPDAAICRDVAAIVLQLLARELGAGRTSHLSGKAEQTFRQICDLVDDHFAQPLDCATVARIVQVHPNHLSRLFQRFAGVSFVAYLRGVRLRQARALLRSGGHTVAETATLCGFSSPGYLARCYQRAYGCAPGQDKG